MPKKLLLFVFFLILSVFSLAAPNVVLAQYVNQDSLDAGTRIVDYNDADRGTIYDVVNEQQASVVNTGQNIGKQVKNIVYPLLAETFMAIAGVPSENVQTTQNTSTGNNDLSAIGSVTGFIAGMYNTPPASSETYVADVMQNAHIVPQAYAQGLGFSSLTPILDTWKVFRNIAYFFFIIVFLAIGFMIMFRQRMGGQTAVTAQQAIPRIIVALLAVTFSYAIAGLLIDLMYILMYLLIGLFSADSFVDFNIFRIGGKMILGTAGSANKAISDFVSSSISLDLDIGLGNVDVGNGVGFVAGALAAVVVALSVLISLFRLFFELLKTYVEIVLSIIMAPFTLMLGAIPGRNTFASWVKGIVGNLSAYVIVLVMLIIFEKVTGGLTNNSGPITSGGFTPPFVVGVQGAGTLSFLIGLGFILILPDLVQKGKKAFGATGGIFEQFSGALGESLKRGWRGDALIPGLGFTEIGKYGLSGESAAKKMGVGLAMAGAGATAIPSLGKAAGVRGLELITGTRRGSAIPSRALVRAGKAGRAAGKALKDPQVNWVSERLSGEKGKDKK